MGGRISQRRHADGWNGACEHAAHGRRENLRRHLCALLRYGAADRGRNFRSAHISPVPAPLPHGKVGSFLRLSEKKSLTAPKDATVFGPVANM
jgi:hypothetical protein